MVDVALAAAFVTGLLSGPVWIPALSITLAAFVMLCIGTDADLMLKMLQGYLVACTIGYSIGRLLAWGWRRLSNGTYRRATGRPSVAPMISRPPSMVSRHVSGQRGCGPNCGRRSSTSSDAGRWMKPMR